ncbi:MAG: hypothetical protein CME19_24805 [Gemmatimonadetes bacterium]|nr:hypothetical protein [Gemmatimonadota bacterium]
MTWPKHLPLPEKRICDLTDRQLTTFRNCMGLNDSGVPSVVVPDVTAEERAARDRRERWKRRFAGKAIDKPTLLVRKEQIARLQKNAKVDATARRYRDRVLDDAETMAALPVGFFHSFIPDMGPWNPGGNFCPNCIHDKSPEGINNYFWNWDWRDPERLECPYCGSGFPNADQFDNGQLILPRLGLVYRYHIREKELATKDWRLGDQAERFVAQPIHVSFSGNVRALRINWSIDRLKNLGLAYALTKDQRYADRASEILTRFAAVYSRYPLQSYFQDVVDADPGFATDNADGLPTIFKRNACIGVYNGRFGYNHEKTTTRETRVATGLWGSSRIARELTTTGYAFLNAIQAYDLTKTAIARETRKDIEQRFLLELYLDTRAYDYITNKAGNIRASRVAFGQMFGNNRETRDGLKGYHAILRVQFHADGSYKETPIYGHKPIGENLWQIPEMLRGKQDLYAESLMKPAFETLARIQTPWTTWPTQDDSFVISSVPGTTFDVALERCGIHIPGPPAPPSEFAILNSDLAKRPRRQSSTKALNHYFEGRHLACAGFGSGKNATQLYVLGEDGCRVHRHAAPLNLQLYTHGWEVFPDLGYICDHPGNQWVKATASHQTVTVDEQNVYCSGLESELLDFKAGGSHWLVDMRLEKDDLTMRRTAILLKKQDGWPILVDRFDVSGGNTLDYAVRVDVPRQAFRVNKQLSPRKRALYQAHSFYPLENFQTGGRQAAGTVMDWGKGDRHVRATVLNDCAELITYQSPGWRSQHEITAVPGKYFNTLVLRNRKKARFLVVYETGPKSVIIPSVSSDQSEIRLAAHGQKDWQIRLDDGQAATIRRT